MIWIICHICYLFVELNFDVKSECKMHFWLEIEMSFNFNYYDEMNFLKEIRFLCAIVLLRNSGILPVVRYISIVHWYDFMPQMDGIISMYNTIQSEAIILRDFTGTIRLFNIDYWFGQWPDISSNFVASQLSEWPLSIQSSIPSWFYGLYRSHLKVQYLHLLFLHRCVES